MNGSFTWEEWEEYKASEAFGNIKFDILLEKDQDEVLELVRKHLEHTQEKMITMVGNIGTGKSTFKLGQMFENNIRPRTGKTSHWLDAMKYSLAVEKEEYHQWTCHPDLVWVDALIPSSEELEKMMRGQVYGFSMDAIHFDESSAMDSTEEGKPKKKKNMRDDVRSFLNKGRKW